MLSFLHANPNPSVRKAWAKNYEFKYNFLSFQITFLENIIRL